MNITWHRDTLWQKFEKTLWKWQNFYTEFLESFMTQIYFMCSYLLFKVLDIIPILFFPACDDLLPRQVSVCLSAEGLQPSQEPESGLPCLRHLAGVSRTIGRRWRRGLHQRFLDRGWVISFVTYTQISPKFLPEQKWTVREAWISCALRGHPIMIWGREFMKFGHQ